MAIKKQRRNGQTPVVVNEEEASAVLQQRGPAPQLSLQQMEKTLRGIGDELDALKARVRQALAPAWELPEGIRAEYLPDGCPGWGNYSTDLMTCGLCTWNFDCMSVPDEREMQSRDQRIAAEVVQKYFRQ
jgi:hypothetical protein